MKTYSYDNRKHSRNRYGTGNPYMDRRCIDQDKDTPCEVTIEQTEAHDSTKPAPNATAEGPAALTPTGPMWTTTLASPSIAKNL